MRTDWIGAMGVVIGMLTGRRPRRYAPTRVRPFRLDVWAWLRSHAPPGQRLHPSISARKPYESASPERARRVAQALLESWSGADTNEARRLWAQAAAIEQLVALSDEVSRLRRKRRRLQRDVTRLQRMRREDKNG